jgi:VCBS repeat-containing protein
MNTNIVGAGEFRVNTFTSGDQNMPSVTALPNGFVVTWTSNGQDGSLQGVYGQRFDADGKPVGPEFLVNTSTAEGQQRPSTTALSDGGFVVTWSTYDITGAVDGVYGQRYNSTGQRIGSEFTVNTAKNGLQQGPSVAALEDGGFVVTWQSGPFDFQQQSLGQDGSGAGVFGQRFNAAGQAVGAEFRANTYTTDFQGTQWVTALKDGGFVVTWQSGGMASDSNWLVGQDGSGGGIYGQRYDANGNRVGLEFLINNTTSSSQIQPVIETLADGGFVVAWTSGSEAYAQRYNSSGSRVGSEFRVVGSDAVTALPDGSFVVMGGATGQLYDASGVPSGTAFRIGPSTSGVFLTGASATTLADGRFVVTWASNQSGPWDVYQQVFDINDAPAVAAVQSRITIEDNPLVAVSIGATDLNDDTLTYSLKTGAGPQHGAVTFNHVNGTFSYSPGTNYSGLDAFTIVVSDGRGGTAEQKVSITVTPVNDKPTGIQLSNARANENSLNGTTVGTLTAQDVDPGDTFSFNLLDNASGRFAIQGNKIVVADGSLLDYEQTNNHLVVVRVTDQSGATFDKSFTISIQDVSEAPSTLPSLTSLSFSSTVNLTSGDKAFTFTAGALDSDGIENVAIRLDKPISFTGPSGYVFKNDTINISDGWDSYDDGQSSMSTTLPVFNASGSYAILDVTVLDKAGNTKVYTPAELAALGPTSLTLVGGRPDASAPSLISLVIPSHVELGSGLTSLTITAGAIDPGSAGVSAVHIKLDKPLLQSYGFGDFALLDEYIVADERLDSFSDGTSPATIQLSPLSQLGTYSILEVVVVDRAGNEQIYTASQIASLGGSTSFTLGRTPPPPPPPPVPPVPPTAFTPSSNFTLPDGALTITASGSANIALTGNALDNSITGNVGKNTINGGAGSDKVNGGLGNDNLTGGSGKDAFVFTTKLGTSTTDRKVNFDTLKDFSAKDDSIYLYNAIFKKLGKKGSEANPAKLDKKFFTVGDKAKDKDDYVIYNKKTGVLSYDADGSGKGQAIEFAQLKKGLALKYNDFFVI